jgi:hypothetical protein
LVARVNLIQKDFSAWDCRILTNGEKFNPGETKEFGMLFLTPEAGHLFAVVRIFYLWEGVIIGEGRPINPQISN